MRVFCWLILLVWTMTTGAAAAEVPWELERALPPDAKALVGRIDPGSPGGWEEGIEQILSGLGDRVVDVVRDRVRGAASILLVVILCGAVEGFYQDEKKKLPFLSVAGACSITSLTAGSLDSLIGLGAETVDNLAVFSGALLPALAAATAATGAVSTAAAQQMLTVAVTGLLIRWIDGLLLPLVYLYIGLLTAAAMLPRRHLDALAEVIRKGITWLLTTVLLGFTFYLSMSRAISGSVDATAVKMTRAAISGAIPVVGSIISEVSETVLAGAGMLKHTIGVFGMLGILGACAWPFLQLGVQYLLYQLTAFLSAVVGDPRLCRLIRGLGGAFGLVLGMTGTCALLLLISVLASVTAVMP